MRNSGFDVLQWLCSAVSHSYVYDNQRVRFFSKKKYASVMWKIVCYLCSKQRNESFFARLNVVALIFRLFMLLLFFSVNIPCQVMSKDIFDTKCISNTKTTSAC